MKRNLYDKLLLWKDSVYRKPLVLKGARQVGKTYLIEEFGKNEFENCIILNCDKDEDARGIFEHALDPKRIISDIKIISGQDIVPGKTLIFIDEVGDAPRALSALKYFCEDAPEYHIAVAGSLLGLAIHKGASFPVGKVDELTLYPMSFSEFVREKHGEELYKRLTTGSLEDLKSLRTVLTDTLRLYYFLGGMPEVIRDHLNGRDHAQLRDMQKRILTDYSLDISKHAEAKDLGRIHQVWNSIPQQLAKSNKKFVYGDIQKGARAKDYESAIGWLIDAGMVYKVSRVRKAGIPLKFYEDFSGFKLFMVDHGLLGALTNAPIQEILLKDNVFEEYRGTFTEQFVFEQMISCLDTDIFYFDSDTSKLELDFLIQSGNVLVPIEVKAEENLRSKSLRQFYLDHPGAVPVRLSMSDYRREEWLTNIPLYAAERVEEAAAPV